ncbi:MAG: choice-of-anchor D domain-containing protein, partial [Candidatus Pacearchaeota archaeon]|nr:choice-of-anchor D domain-containing protein [Candidatus Pacearchaeota archaeon]
ITSGNSVDFDLDIEGMENTIKPNAVTAFRVRFDPLTAGNKAGTITINNNDANEGLYTFAIEGIGTEPMAEINIRQNSNNIPLGSGTFYFDSILVDGDGGTASDYIIFDIQNLGSAQLIVTDINFSSGDTMDFDLDVTGLISTIDPDDYASFSIRFDPLTTGSKNVIVTVNNNDLDEGTYTFTVYGATITPEISIRQNLLSLNNGTGNYNFFVNILADGNDNAASSYVTFTIQNTGSANLAIEDIAPESGDTADFDLDTSITNYTVSPGTSTTFRIRFDPLTLGNKTARILVNNNDLDEGAYTFTVSGTAIAPEINVRQGTTDLLNGSGTYDFGNITADGNNGSYKSATITFTIQNLGTSSLSISGVALINGDTGDFDLSTTVMSSTVSSGSSTSFTLAFDPLTIGNKTVTVLVNSNDSDESEYTFTVIGNGLSPEPEVEVRQGSTVYIDGLGNYEFGSITADGNDGIYYSSYIHFLVYNFGTTNLTVTSISLTGDTADFDITTSFMPKIVDIGSAIYFSIRLDPVTSGSKTATVTIMNSDTDEGEYTFTISGIGIDPAPEIDVLQDSSSLPSGTGAFDFGDIQADGNGSVDSDTVTFTINNTGTANLSITSIALTDGDVGDFDLSTPTLPRTVYRNNSTSFTIRFDPLSVGSKGATVTIVNDDIDEGTYTFSIGGNGTEPAPEINIRRGSTDIPSSTGSYDFGTMYVDGNNGDATSYVTFTIENLGGADLDISDISLYSGYIDDFDLTKGSTPVTLSSGSTTTFSVRFDPETAGSRYANIYIFNNDANEDQYYFRVNGSATSQIPDIYVSCSSGSLPDGSGHYEYDDTYADGNDGYSDGSPMYKIDNTGNSTLTVSSITVSNSTDFELNAGTLPKSIAPGSYTLFN